MQGLLSNQLLKCWSHRLGFVFLHSVPQRDEAAWTPCLKAIARRKTRKGTAALYRAKGLISAVVYEGVRSEGQQTASDNPLLVFLKEREISELLTKMGHRVFFSTVFVLDVCSWLNSEMETFTHRVLPRTLNVDELGKISNLRLVRAPAGIKLKLNCPVVFLGAKECTGIKKGGLLKKYYTYLPFSCVAELLPPAVEVDINGLNIGDRILIGDLKSKLDLHPDLDPASPICEIVEKI